MSLLFRHSLTILIVIIMVLFPSQLYADPLSLSKPAHQSGFSANNKSLIAYDQKNLSLFHSVVKNSILLENERFFKEINKEKKGFAEHYFDSYTVELFKRKNQMPLETEPYYDNITDDDDIKREIAMSSGMSALRETIADMPLVVKIEQIMKDISRYLIIEYSKDDGGLEPALYLPGELHPGKTETKKEYYVSLSTSFDPDTYLLKGNLPIELRFGYSGFSTNTVYDIGNQKLSINLYKKDLSMLPGANFGISLNHDRRWEFIGLFQFSYDF